MYGILNIKDNRHIHCKGAIAASVNCASAMAASTVVA